MFLTKEAQGVVERVCALQPAGFRMLNLPVICKMEIMTISPCQADRKIRDERQGDAAALD